MYEDLHPSFTRMIIFDWSHRGSVYLDFIAFEEIACNFVCLCQKKLFPEQCRKKFDIYTKIKNFFFLINPLPPK